MSRRIWFTPEHSIDDLIEPFGAWLASGRQAQQAAERQRFLAELSADAAAIPEPPRSADDTQPLPMPRVPYLPPDDAEIDYGEAWDDSDKDDADNEDGDTLLPSDYEPLDATQDGDW